MPRAGLNLLYVHSKSLGYGRLGVYLAQELQKMGVSVYDHLPGTERDPAQAHLNVGEHEKICNVVCWISVPTHARGWYSNQYPVIFSMWESTHLPESFRETLHEFELVIVPSLQNVELFSKYHRNVRMVPLGVDPTVWHYRERQSPGQFFNFLISGSGPRKGTDLAVKAFRRVFKTWPSTGPVPRLIMKNPRGEDFYGSNIEMVTGRLSDEAEVELYAQAHCYLQPSRGEGFGLQPLQAMAQGCPTILTDAHGHESFAHLGMGISATLTQSAYFIYGDAGDWWEPDLDELCERMRYVYDNFDAAQELAKINAKTIRKSWTWRQTAQEFVDAIGRDRLCMSCEPGPWKAPEIKRFLVRVNKFWQADIGGTMYQFHVDTDYYEPADVKRILFEADLLDVSCIQQMKPDGEIFETGLTPEQCSRLGDYTAAHSRCALCHQPLNGTSDQLLDTVRSSS